MFMTGVLCTVCGAQVYLSRDIIIQLLLSAHIGAPVCNLDVFVPRLSRKRGTLKLICLSVSPSVRPSVRLSVTKTLTWLISSEVLMIEHWYLACMILVTSPFYRYHAMTLTFDLLQGQICCRAGDHNSSNLLVMPFISKTLFYKLSFLDI